MTTEEKTAVFNTAFSQVSEYLPEEIYIVSEDNILYRITCSMRTDEETGKIIYGTDIDQFAPHDWPITELSLTEWRNFEPPEQAIKYGSYHEVDDINHLEYEVAWLEQEYLGVNWHVLQENTSEINNLLAGLTIKSYDCPVCNGRHTITGVETFCHEYTGHCSNCKARLHYTRIVPNYEDV